MKIAVVIPCFKCKKHILKVINSIGQEVKNIYIIDDACPDNTGKFVEVACNDNRVKVIYNRSNLGVGGAVKVGYRKSIEDGVDIIVKIDGDGQMDPSLINKFIFPIVRGKADYTKGNRFFDLSSLDGMPFLRLVGNSTLSFVNKLVSGYWDIMDPTNGYTAIHVNALKFVSLNKIDNGYFFESDMLFRLGTIRALVVDVPMKAIYETEESNLKIQKIIFNFTFKYINRFWKRLIYNYFLRDFNAGSVLIVIGTFLTTIGGAYGAMMWVKSYTTGSIATSGTVMCTSQELC